MSLPSAIFQMLSATNISNIVSNRIFPLYAPIKTTRPFIIYKIGPLSPTETKNSSRNMDIRGLTILSYAESYNDLHTLFEAIRTEIVRKHTTIDSVKFDSIILENEDDDYDPEDKIFFGIQNYKMRING